MTNRGGWGGEREGAGRPSGDDEPPEGRADYERHRARHEGLKADERAFKLAIARGDYLPRDVQRQASATALAVLVQSLRSLPDQLERRAGLSPEQAEVVGVEIDRALTEIAYAFRAMTNDLGVQPSPQ